MQLDELETIDLEVAVRKDMETRVIWVEQTLLTKRERAGAKSGEKV